MLSTTYQSNQLAIRYTAYLLTCVWLSRPTDHSFHITLTHQRKTVIILRYATHTNDVPAFSSPAFSVAPAGQEQRQRHVCKQFGRLVQCHLDSLQATDPAGEGWYRGGRSTGHGTLYTGFHGLVHGGLYSLSIQTSMTGHSCH